MSDQLNNDAGNAARALHRVVRAMHDGECPRCHKLHDSRDMPFTDWNVIDAYVRPPIKTVAKAGHRCPSCGFEITREQSEAALAEFHPFMERNLAIFEDWRTKRNAAPSPSPAAESSERLPDEGFDAGREERAVSVAADPSEGKVESHRDKLGRRVREVWVAWAHRQPDPKSSWLVPYEQLSDADQEADRCIGAALWGDGFAAGVDSVSNLGSLPSGEAGPTRGTGVPDGASPACPESCDCATMCRLSYPVLGKPRPSFDTLHAESHGHVLYRASDKDAPDSIRDSNGEVVLGLCRVCGRGEIELSEPCHQAVQAKGEPTIEDGARDMLAIVFDPAADDGEKNMAKNTLREILWPSEPIELSAPIPESPVETASPPSEPELDLSQFEGHTPGPWSMEDVSSVKGNPEWTIDIHHGEGMANVCEVYAGDKFCERAATARLIAAAPQLLRLATSRGEEVERLKAGLKDAREQELAAKEIARGYNLSIEACMKERDTARSQLAAVQGELATVQRAKQQEEGKGNG